MAKRSPHASTARGAQQRGRARAAKATSKKVTVPAGGVEIVEEPSGMNIEAGIAILTTILLLAAILLVDAHLGKYGSGIFFK